MNSIKCPQCGLINFVSSQFCKRCNAAINQFGNTYHNNETQLLTNDTHFREVVQPQFESGENYSAEYGFSGAADERDRQTHNSNGGWTLPRFPHDERREYYAKQAHEQQQQQFYNHHQQSPPFNQHYQPAGFPARRDFYNEPAVRRFGNEIALHKSGSLPLFCVKCGKSVTSSFDGSIVAENFRWHNPLVYIALISPLIYLILALCLSHRFTVNTPLCHEHYKNRQDAKNYMIGGALLLVPLIFVSGSWGYPGFAVLLFFLGLIGLPLMHTYLYKSLTVKNVDGNYYHLKGASAEFLSKIPY